MEVYDSFQGVAEDFQRVPEMFQGVSEVIWRDSEDFRSVAGVWGGRFSWIFRGILGGFR